MCSQTYALMNFLHHRNAFAEILPFRGETEDQWTMRLATARLNWELAKEDLQAIVEADGPIEAHDFVARLGGDGVVRVDRLRIGEAVHVA